MTGADIAGQVSGLLDDVAELVSCESPSGDVEALTRCADLVDELALRRIDAKAERVIVQGRPHLRWQFGTPRIVLVGHLDTVWPVGTLARWPFEIDGDRMTGPGVFDMKTGLVQLFMALKQLDDLDGVGIVINSDEEIGSTSSQELIENTCRGT